MQFIKFNLFFILGAGATYFLHNYFYGFFTSENYLPFLNFSYKFNVGITFLYLMSIILISKKLKEQIGFVFMAASMLKLLIFFFLVKFLGWEIGRKELLNFFIPYAFCLAFEIFYVVKILNSTNFNKDN